MNRVGRRLHIAGILGTGMNAVAQLAVHRGRQVAGSDRFIDRAGGGGTATCLESMGIRLHPQNGSGLDRSTDTVIVSSAIEDDNPDLEAARGLGVTIMHRSEALADLLGPGRLIGIAGTSGKTTVTGMLGWILSGLGWDPTVVNGGALIDWRGPDRIGNVRNGNGPWQVVELDESDRSLLRFHPQWAVITNITADHFDADQTGRLFQQFRSQVLQGAVGALDNDIQPAVFATPDLDHAKPDSSPPNTRNESSWRFDFEGHTVNLRLPGRHNAINAWQSLALCKRLGCDTNRAIEVLQSFSGIERRLEQVAVKRHGPVVYDDFAHNPAKIAAAIEAVRPNDGRLVAVWQPHGFGPLRLMFEDLIATFTACLRAHDTLLLLPVYFAGGTAVRTVTSADLVARLREHGIQAFATADWVALADALSDLSLHHTDVLLMMGARDPVFSQRVRETIEALAEPLQAPVSVFRFRVSGFQE